MVDTLKKYKFALWMSGVLPFILFNCALAVSTPRVSNLIMRVIYIAIILFAIIFSFFRININKIKVWRGVLEAILIIPLYLLFLFVWFMILFWQGIFDLSGVQ